MSLRRKLAAFAIANLLAMPLMAGVVQAQLTNEASQDRTVVTLDVPTSFCVTVIDDLSMGKLMDNHRGPDLDLHDQDDASAFTGGDFWDGFDQTGPDYNPDYSDSAFSRMSRLGYLWPSNYNITTDDPDAGALWNPSEVQGVETDGSGYVDLYEFDWTSHSYGASFVEGVWCSGNSYDVWIADTFNLDPGAFSGADKVDYNKNDIALTGTGSYTGTGANNLNKREGLFRIAHNSLRDITDGYIVPGAETATIKHEYIMDLPAEGCGGTVGGDDWQGDCPMASLDINSSNGLRLWPYEGWDLSYVQPMSNEFGTVGFTLLCSSTGISGTGATGTYGYGRINPFTRGWSDITSATGGAFYADAAGNSKNTDCDEWNNPTYAFIGDDWLPNTEDDLVRNQYAAIPSLENFGSADGIAGIDPTTYGAIMGPDNWVGTSGPINPAYVPTQPANPLEDPWYTGTGSYNIYEVRASLPSNQVAGTYAGTIILACLPNMTDPQGADFEGDGGPGDGAGLASVEIMFRDVDDNPFDMTVYEASGSGATSFNLGLITSAYGFDGSVQISVGEIGDSAHAGEGDESDFDFYVQASGTADVTYLPASNSYSVDMPVQTLENTYYNVATVYTNNNAMMEGDISYTVGITQVSGGQKGKSVTGIVTIKDND